MLEQGQTVEIVRIRPKAGAADQLLALRDELVQSYRDFSDAFVHATLFRLEGDTEWVDVWVWKGRAGAEAGLADPTEPFKAWGELVELVSLEWAEVATDHAR